MANDKEVLIRMINYLNDTWLRLDARHKELEALHAQMVDDIEATPYRSEGLKQFNKVMATFEEIKGRIETSKGDLIHFKDIYLIANEQNEQES